MSDYRIQRKGSSKKSSRGGRRRRSSVRSMGSYGAKDDVIIFHTIATNYRRRVEAMNETENSQVANEYVRHSSKENELHPAMAAG
ncbi:hypothetical protein PoB_001774200 [Plakobranchus ocellatus]|uniref:Uncharacterized protein n=1 Tax=Plakobranchus ocellatus TaxID=259542 RepID=A0AAV3Z9N2_9GAST|nr:hypothetical protein PoB_001774200 [Plakobranchus ocellatus]